MTHLEALNYLISYYQNGTSVSSQNAKLQLCIEDQKRRPYSLPPKPTVISPWILLSPVLIFLVAGLALIVVFGITGLLSKYYLFGYIHYPAMKIGCFIFSLFGGKPASVVTVDFVRAWCNETTWSGFWALITGYAGTGLGIGILLSVIFAFDFPSELAAWKQRCTELTPEKFEEEEDRRIADEKNRQIQLEQDLAAAKAAEQTASSLIKQLSLPYQYQNEKSLTVLRGYILNGRAYTVADAINCAIADNWRSEQAKINQDAARNAEEARDYAKRTYDELHRN